MRWTLQSQRERICKRPTCPTANQHASVIRIHGCEGRRGRMERTLPATSPLPMPGNQSVIVLYAPYYRLATSPLSVTIRVALAGAQSSKKDGASSWKIGRAQACFGARAAS